MFIIDRFLRHGGFALVVILVGSIGLVKSANFYGTLLRGFDGQFYYAAARSIVVSGDWDVSDDLPFSPLQGPFKTDFGLPTRPDGGTKNVYAVGLSLIEAALLAPAMLLSSIFKIGNGPSGYSPFEVWWVAFGLLLVGAIGLQATYAFARTLSTPVSAAFITLAAWLGTPLLYYMAWFPFSSHPSAFTVMILLLVVADRMPKAQRLNLNLFFFGLLAALLYLIRPHQTLYVVLLAAWRILPMIRMGGRSWIPGAIAGFAICVAAVILQASIHKLNLGFFAVIGHGEHSHPMISGHFDLLDPHFDIVLFSSARGLFWITPIILLSLVGYISRWRAIPWWGMAVLINAIIETSILAFWSDPFQGDSFGIRLWAEHVPVVVCGLALLFQATACGGRLLCVTVGVVTVTCVTWTMLLSGCYIYGKIQPGMSHLEVLSQVARSINRR